MQTKRPSLPRKYLRHRAVTRGQCTQNSFKSPLKSLFPRRFRDSRVLPDFMWLKRGRRSLQTCRPHNSLLWHAYHGDLNECPICLPSGSLGCLEATRLLAYGDSQLHPWKLLISAVAVNPLPLQTCPSALFFKMQKMSLSSLWRLFCQFTPLPNPVPIPGSCPAHSTLYNALGLPKLLRTFLFTVLCNVNLSLACQWNRKFFF